MLGSDSVAGPSPEPTEPGAAFHGAGPLRHLPQKPTPPCSAVSPSRANLKINPHRRPAAARPRILLAPTLGSRQIYARGDPLRLRTPIPFPVLPSQGESLVPLSPY